MSRSPRRSAAFLYLARRYVRRALARDLDGLRVAGLERARAAVQGGPVILAANHVGFWDSFLVVALDEALGTEGRALMHRENLSGLPFFGWLGAIPLDPARPREGLRRAGALLDRPGRAVWIFPQGGHRPAHLRPLGFEPGVRLLARLAPRASTVPVALQYAWDEAAVPRAWVCFGEPLLTAAVAAPGGPERVEGATEAGLARIDRALGGDTAGWTQLVPSRHRRPDRGVGARLLAALGGAARG